MGEEMEEDYLFLRGRTYEEAIIPSKRRKIIKIHRF
jgi:hypothetical protein